MKKGFIPAGLLMMGFLAIAVLLETGCSAPEQEGAVTRSPVERGKYLVTLGGCNDCHTPKNFTPQGPVPDETRLLAGHPADAKLPEFTPDMVAPGKWYLFNSHLTAGVGPWGISYAANLTPDEATGMGLWTEEIFIQAMRTGKHMGSGRPILPPMPWQGLAQATDEDLKAMFGYLQSVPPIKNAVPAPVEPGEVGSK
jgi:hypothetical protein